MEGLQNPEGNVLVCPGELRDDGRQQQTDLGLSLSTKRTRKREFLAQMEQVVPCTDLVDLVSPYARRPATQDRLPAVRLADHAAHSFHATVVHAE